MTTKLHILLIFSSSTLILGSEVQSSCKRPCSNFDVDCIRNYFECTGSCSKADGEVPLPLIWPHSDISIPIVNVTGTRSNLEVIGFDWKITEFYNNSAAFSPPATRAKTTDHRNWVHPSYHECEWTWKLGQPVHEVFCLDQIPVGQTHKNYQFATEARVNHCINPITNRAVLGVKITDLKVDIKDLLIKYWLPQREPEVVLSTAKEHFPSLTLTTVFENSDTLALKDSSSYVFFDVVPTAILGPEVSNCKGLQKPLKQFYDNSEVALTEAFSVPLQKFAAIFIQYSICNYGNVELY